METFKEEMLRFLIRNYIGKGGKEATFLYLSADSQPTDFSTSAVRAIPKPTAIAEVGAEAALHDFILSCQQRSRAKAIVVVG